MFKKKKIQMAVPPVQPKEYTLAERLQAASVAAAAATNIFQVAAENLDRASDDLDGVAAAAEAEADNLMSLVVTANYDADRNRRQASAIRTAMGVN